MELEAFFSIHELFVILMEDFKLGTWISLKYSNLCSIVHAAFVIGHSQIVTSNNLTLSHEFDACTQQQCVGLNIR